MKIQVAIALGLIAGLVLGIVAAATQAPALLTFAEGVAPIGTAFVNLLKMVVIPLVAVTLFVGVAGMGDLRELGRLGLWSLAFFAGTTLVAVVIGMGVMHLLLPLADIAAAQAVAQTAHHAAPRLPGTVDFLLSLIPSNPFKAAADGDLLALIVFTCFFGAAVATLAPQQKQRLVELAEAATGALIKIVHWILWTAPLGVFALAAPVTARSGLAVLESLAVFVGAVLVGLAIFVALVYLPIVHAGARIPATKFLSAALESQMIAFSTTSSATAIPAMLEATDGPLAVGRETSSFVIPLGATLNRAGSALFQGAALIFLAWLYRVPIPAGAIGAAIFATALVSITVASVPSASVITLAPALGAVGVPLDGLAVLLGVDRIPDMFRTATNVTGDLAAAAVLDRRLKKDGTPQ